MNSNSRNLAVKPRMACSLEVSEQVNLPLEALTPDNVFYDDHGLGLWKAGKNQGGVG
jgi:hypothetical protein